MNILNKQEKLQEALLPITCYKRLWIVPVHGEIIITDPGFPKSSTIWALGQINKSKIVVKKHKDTKVAMGGFTAYIHNTYDIMKQEYIIEDIKNYKHASVVGVVIVPAGAQYIFDIYTGYLATDQMELVNIMTQEEDINAEEKIKKLFKQINANYNYNTDYV